VPCQKKKPQTAPGVHVEVLDVLAVGRGNVAVAAAGDGPDLGAEPRSSTVHRDGPDTVPGAGAELVLMRAEARRAAEAQQKADVQQRPGRRSHRRTTSCTRADRPALH
jgi:hypothetical protein